ncbi:very short patch repair endonuclease [Microbacterium sp. KKR3/1]|nr:very short patch repair endonuclease [Microbacterium sp. KKR3/1]
MRGNRSRDTKPEVEVRRLLHRRGFRYRVQVRPIASLRRTADIAFVRRRIAIFIDGCFWHGCPDHYVESKSNTKYWGAKISANVSRDSDTNSVLEAAGWTVLRFWTHLSPEEIADSIANVIRPRDLQEAEQR